MKILINNKTIQILIIFIVFDTIFGFFRSIKQHKTNSSIGIDGIIRKCCMLFTITGCVLLDYIVDIDLIHFIPEEVKQSLNFSRIGISDLFAILYSLFEILSIFKNMYKLGIPLPIKLKNFLEKLLKDFTKEVEEK